MKARITRFPSVVVFFGIAAASLPCHLTATQSVSPTRGVSDSELTAVVIRFGIPASSGELTAAVQARVTRGDRLTAMRRFATAEEEYRTAAAIARREGHLPSLTLWHLASAYYYQGDLQSAAVVLDQLRVEAVRSGDLGVEALALFNAAWLNGHLGRRQAAETRIADLRNLLPSPYMPAGIRDHLSPRLTTSSDLAIKP
jgi:hypothetical protein